MMRRGAAASVRARDAPARNAGPPDDFPSTRGIIATASASIRKRFTARTATYSHPSCSTTYSAVLRPSLTLTPTMPRARRPTPRTPRLSRLACPRRATANRHHGGTLTMPLLSQHRATIQHTYTLNLSFRPSFTSLPSSPHSSPAATPAPAPRNRAPGACWRQPPIRTRRRPAPLSPALLRSSFAHRHVGATILEWP